MRLFDELNIETCATCNRTCPTCLRQSYPDKAALAAHFDPANVMPAETVHSIIDQAVALGGCRWLCLQHFNEPLQDERIAGFGAYAKATGAFTDVYINTNGDYLTEAKAAALDGCFDHLNIALYSGDKAKREAQYRGWFTGTRLTFTQGEHLVTHFSPLDNLTTEIATCISQPCDREAAMRCIIRWDGRMSLCCDDIANLYGLGSIHDTALADLWFGPRHTAILALLSQPGGRYAFPYCQICPRPNTPYWGEWA